MCPKLTPVLCGLCFPSVRVRTSSIVTVTFRIFCSRALFGCMGIDQHTVAESLAPPEESGALGCNISYLCESDCADGMSASQGLVPRFRRKRNEGSIVYSRAWL